MSSTIMAQSLTTYSRADVNQDNSVNVEDVTDAVNATLACANFQEGRVVDTDELNQTLQQIFDAIRSLEKKIGAVEAAVDPFGTYEYVDLGLTSETLWATCNVGASDPEGYGLFFAWADTQSHELNEGSNSSYTNYKWITPGLTPKDMSKYTMADGQTDRSWYDGDTFIGDNLTTVLPEDDAARAAMGGGWRMPTREEMEELMNQCTWVYEKRSNSNGYKITGPNGNVIFIPAATQKLSYPTTSTQQNRSGYYWTASLDEADSTNAYSFIFDNNSKRMMTMGRYDWRAIRPVCKKVQK